MAPDLGVLRVDLEGCVDVDDLIPMLLAKFGHDPRGPSYESVPQFVVQLSSRTIVRPRSMNETDVEQLVRAAQIFVAEGSRAVVLADNLRGSLARDFFGRFRDTLWQAPIIWIAAGDSASSGYLDPPADVFWESVEWLNSLDDDETTELLGRRIEVDPDDDAARYLREHLAELVDLLVNPSPRDVLRAAANATDATRPGLVTARFEHGQLEAAHRAGGRRAGMLVAELQQLGRPAHADDPELRERMGLTRSRLVQLLGALEKANIVERHRQGRKVYFGLKPPNSRKSL